MKTLAYRISFKTLVLAILFLMCSFNTVKAHEGLTKKEPVLKKQSKKEKTTSNKKSDTYLRFNQKDNLVDKYFENEIQLEKWMLDANPKHWNIKVDSIQEEKELEIEEWMLDLSSW